MGVSLAALGPPAPFVIAAFCGLEPVVSS